MKRGLAVKRRAPARQPLGAVCREHV